MIPQAYIQARREHAPWPNPAQVEHDLIICRALCDLFNAPALAGKLAFRGGTAIHELLFKRPMRCSEDNDLVQTQAEPIRGRCGAVFARFTGAIESSTRSSCDSWHDAARKRLSTRTGSMDWA